MRATFIISTNNSKIANVINMSPADMVQVPPEIMWT